MTSEGRFAAALDEIFASDRPRRLGLAVSGGGDSMALMHLAAAWAPPHGVALEVVTVDHGLRPEAAHEAERVAAAAAKLGLRHCTLLWTGWDGTGNLQDAARRARRALIEDWAESLGLDAILTGHTLDDQAETVLMRLARGSGVDGFAGIAPVRIWRLRWARPLLSIRRDALREWLANRGVAWVEDPSNDDPRFDRVRARRILAELAPLGPTAERLAATARHLRLGQEVLEAAAAALADRAARTEAGDVLIALVSFGDAPLDTRTRLLSAALRWVSGAPYRPRYAPVERLARVPRDGTLHGCLLTMCEGLLRVSREPAAVRDIRCPTTEIWDGRWRLDGPHAAELEVRALGRAGLDVSPDRRQAGLPAATLEASPAIWREDTLVAAPLAGLGGGWSARLVAGRDDFTLNRISR